MNIRALTLDLDDTLWALRPVMERAEREVIAFAQREIPQAAEQLADRQKLWTVRNELLAETPQLQCDLSQWRLHSYRRLLERTGWPLQRAQQAAEQLFEVFFHWRNQVELFEGVEPVLQQLTGTLVLGALTNGNADPQRIGIGQHLDFSLNPQQIGSGKPDLPIFQAAAQAADCHPGEVIHLGDDPALDVAGARRAGMQAIWFNPAGLTWSGEGPEPPQLSRWADLPELLKSCQRALRG